MAAATVGSVNNRSSSSNDSSIDDPHMHDDNQHTSHKSHNRVHRAYGNKTYNFNIQHMFAGALAGVSARFILQPLDLIKVRLQVQDGSGHNEYRGMRHAFTSIVRDEGVVGLYRGMSANLLGAGMSWGSYFFAYSNLKDLYR